MDIILIPGMWLDGASWDAVVPALEKAGHRTHPLTLPGLESPDADRSGVTLRDHVAATVAAIDAVDPTEGQVVLVGHSAGGMIAHAAADARPDRVARVVYLAGEPQADGATGPDFPVEHGEMPLPDWSAFDEEMVADLDDQQRAAFRERAIPWPAEVAREPVRLSDDRRYDVPATVIACEYSSATLQKWVTGGVPGTEELGKLRAVEYVDLPGGHWPQLTRPEEVARTILASIDPT